MITGTVGSSGIALGKVWVLSDPSIKIDGQKRINEKEIEVHIQRFSEAKGITISQIEEIKQEASDVMGMDEEQIFEAHLMFLKDEEFVNEILFLIRSELFTAEAAVDKVISQSIESLALIDDDYLKERASDMRDIGDRLIRNILGMSCSLLGIESGPVIIVADDLAPSQTAQLDLKRVKGFILNRGGSTSHTAIVARSLEIPAIVGTGNATRCLKNEDWVILDAIHNRIVINPDEKEICSFRRIRKVQDEKIKVMTSLKEKKAITKDGHSVKILANIGSLEELDGVLKSGADGIGLFRTEFLFMNGKSFPCEDAQFNAYRTIAQRMKDKPVHIRTLDIGGDKLVPSVDFQHEANPFLGWRAIRFCFDHPSLFMNQIRAILRASAFGNVKLMFPMVISLEEVLKLKAIVRDAKEQLQAEKIPFNPQIEMGLVIETPSAALMVNSLIEEVDFLSIGTNDLTQYTLAVDRGNEKVSKLYDPLAPSVIRLIRMVIDASKKHRKSVAICGEMASDPKAFLLLMGMGVDSFSMSASSVLMNKQIAIVSVYEELAMLGKKISMVRTKSELDKLLDGYLEKMALS